jgi:hypothetical protein
MDEVQRSRLLDLVVMFGLPGSLRNPKTGPPFGPAAPFCLPSLTLHAGATLCGRARSWIDEPANDALANNNR